MGATPASEAVRFGMIVPSSNVTMEREIPSLLGLHAERFAFHSSRVRMRSVTPEELAAMNAQSSRACGELADAQVDVVAYACLVAVMAEGPGAHRRAEERLAGELAAEGSSAPVVSSAGALVDTLAVLGAERVGVIAPYAPALTERVCEYLRAEGVDPVHVRSLGVTDNTAVGRLDPSGLPPIAREIPSDIDALVLSACVQMPSLPVLAAVEQELGIPVLSAATATVFQSLRRLGQPTTVPGGGHLLSGAFDALTGAGKEQ